MRVICAPDKFKQCCTAAEAAKAMAEGVRLANPSVEVTELPVADGGEGTLDVLASEFAERRTAKVQNARGREVEAQFSLNGKRALIESSQACGLWRLDEADRDPNITHTHGVGELIRAALDAGAEEILVGLGGSATNDGGAGMAVALGAKFFDEAGDEMTPAGGNLRELRRVDLSGMDQRLKEVKLIGLCDVMTPMLGEHGSSRNFVLQKGGTTKTMHKLEESLAMLELQAREAGASGDGLEPGSGAAGGLGYGIHSLLGGELVPGARTVLELIGFESQLEGVDLVLTGEGSYDHQTPNGKLIAVLAEICKSKNVTLVVLAGAAHNIEIEGVTAAFGISTYGERKQDSLNEGRSNLTRFAEYVTRLLRKHG